MPPLPPVPNVLRVYLTGFIDNEHNQNWGNVIHVQYSGTAPTNATCAAIAGNIRSNWGISMAPECPGPTTLQQVVVTDLSSDTAGEGEDLTVVAGTRGDDSTPANSAVLISYPIQNRYRGGHPRQYLYVGGVADFEGAGKWSTLFYAEALAHWKTFIASFLGLGFSGCTLNQLVAVSYVNKASNPVPPHRRAVPLVIPLVIGTAISHQQIASMKSRIGRSRRNAPAGTP